MENNDFKICTRCIMDLTDPNIAFNIDGICNHCLRYDNLISNRIYHGTTAEQKLQKLIKKIKNTGKNSEYDCIIGVSGGVDSTYVAFLTKKLGLKPLAIHFDNGWNSELAVSNIEKTLEILDIDLYTYVIDWNVFKDLQVSFLKASTPDGEIPTDHAINALLFREANKRNIKYIINGMNFATESMEVDAWAYGHSDWKYIKNVQKKFGSKNLKSYPKFRIMDVFYWTAVKGIHVVSLLNYVDYNKEQVMALLKNKLGWVYYGGKHYESVYTRFYQGYYLPKKFNIDKRKGHLSDLIRSGQLSRDEAILQIQQPLYNDLLLRQDIDFVIKKLGMNEKSFDKILKSPNKSYSDYPNNKRIIIVLKKVLTLLRKRGLYSR